MSAKPIPPPQPVTTLLNGVENLDGPDLQFSGSTWTTGTFLPPAKPNGIATVAREVREASAEPARRPAAPATMFEVFARMAADPAIPIDRIKQLMDMQEQAEAREAERQFNDAFARLSFPPIGKTAKGKNSDYAPYEEIQAVITPILAENGFGWSFTSGEPTAQGIPLHGILRHVAGHSEISTLYLPRDRSGSMNEIQGMGSTSSYGMRYLSKMRFNLRIIGEDNDGATVRPDTVTHAQAESIRAMFTRCKMDKASQQGFFRAMQVECVSQILQSQYGRAMSLLNAKLRKVEAK